MVTGEVLTEARTAARAARARHLHELSEQRAAALRGGGPQQGEEPGRAAVRHLRHACRPISARRTSTTSIASAARSASTRRPKRVSARDPRTSPSSRPATPRARWCRSAPIATDRLRRPAPIASSHYNVYLAADINGQAAPGYSSGQATAAMERVLAQTLPNGFGYEWTELAFQQKSASGYRRCRVRAVRAAGVPDSCRAVRELVAAARDHPDRADVPAVLDARRVAGPARTTTSSRRSASSCSSGLACKNAILIVEFARERVEQRHGRHRGGDRSMPTAAAADPHDLLRIHHGRACRW